MARKITQKELKHDEFVEAGLDIGAWVEEHWQTAAKWAVVVVLGVVGVLVGLAWNKSRQDSARGVLAAAIDRYDELRVDGFSDQAALESLITDLDGVGSGDAGRIASFYKGSALLELDRLDEARQALASVGGSNAETLGATAKLMLARIDWESGAYADALAKYDELIGDESSAAPTSQLQLDAGRILFESGDTDAARERWQKVLDDYPATPAAGEARNLLR